MVFRAYQLNICTVLGALSLATQLAGAFVIETLVWGLPNAYGALLVQYLEDPAWASQKHARGLLPLVGPMASGIMYSACECITNELWTKS